ncbi:TRAP transporter large permease [Anaerotruncus massiliensis (ex Liu et al. 2021)]|uniref:TRAP transporter large permease n=3 Tax=Oscillospiraceae TaxID=216572 RepID=A0A498CN41_9FIRM|nr:TRAP transporter large permease [Anaerotruncus massiliensis (ex Togo et al. 2019)]RLL12827.1 TRAP transporter large permease [Anaerotruncus massiliensis (ex Liu et al. 2021)]
MGALPVYLMFALFLLGVPVAIALIACVLPYFLFINPTMPPQMVLQRLVAQVESSSLWAVPFFITAGAVLNYAGVTKRLMNLCEGIVGHLPGALGQVNVLLSALMGGISGSAASDAATECKILVPEMLERGYDKDFSAAVTAASSMITPIIPPGIGLILFAFVANVSVGRMFLAGWIPGIIMTVGMMMLVHMIAKRRGYVPTRTRPAKGKELLLLVKDAGWALVLPLVIIMAIRIGIVTASECGALCVFYALFVGVFIHRELKMEHIWPILKDAVTGTATVLVIMCAANVLSFYLSYERLPHRITEYLTTVQFNRVTFLLMVDLIFVLLGLFMEGGAAIIIMVPLLLGTAQALGIDMIHFGLLIVFITQIGAVTPPFGMVIFLVSPLLDIPISRLSKALLPFIGLLIFCMLLFTFIPVLSTWLPTLVYG